ncbi:MAG TPA: S41 family peptidase [Phycisphaerae bacterium]|nr:S41 family peptidase [Phycisphaerae bacterium]
MTGQTSLSRGASMVWGAVLVLGQVVLGNSAPAEKPSNKHLESFDVVWETVRDTHWDPELGGLDWDAVRAELRPRAAQAGSAAEARRVMQEMLNRLGQSHFVIYPQGAYGAAAQTDGAGCHLVTEADTSCGFEVRVSEGRAVVTLVHADSPAGRAGVQTEWEVIRVGEYKPPEGWSQVGAVASRLAGVKGSSVSVGFVTPVGEDVDVVLELPQRRVRRYGFGHLPPLVVSVEYKLLEGNIGYITFNWFFDPILVMPQFEAAMEAFSNADGIIIDIRRNGGGMSHMGTAMAGWFIDEEGRYFGKMYMRDAEMTNYVYPRARTYDGPVAVLVDGGCGSAAEIFAAGMQDLGRARVFGSRTMGGVLPVSLAVLPNGDRFQYAIARYVSAGGAELEGRGVIPDVKVRSGMRSSDPEHDPVMKAAVAWIRGQASGS